MIKREEIVDYVLEIVGDDLYLQYYVKALEKMIAISSDTKLYVTNTKVLTLSDFYNHQSKKREEKIDKIINI
mgnify:CR=1 FL=1